MSILPKILRVNHGGIILLFVAVILLLFGWLEKKL